MIKSEYYISKMDCPSEENMIRMKPDGISAIKKVDFDLTMSILVHNLYQLLALEPEEYSNL